MSAARTTAPPYDRAPYDRAPYDRAPYDRAPYDGAWRLAAVLAAGAVLPHDLTFADDRYGAIATVTGGQSRSITLTFDAAGSYDFFCSFHPGQVGKVLVA